MAILLLSNLGAYCLVYWSQEESVTTVSHNDIVQPVDGEIREGVKCAVRCGRKLHEGVVAATGKLCYIVLVIYIDCIDTSFPSSL